MGLAELGKIQKQENVDDRAIEISSDEEYGSKENKNKLYLRDKENSETEKKYNRKDNTKKKSKSKHVIMVTKTEGAVIKQKTLNNKNQENIKPKDSRMMIEKGTNKHKDGSEEEYIEEGDIERGGSSTMRYFEIRQGRQEDFIENKHRRRGGDEESKPGHRIMTKNYHHQY